MSQRIVLIYIKIYKSDGYKIPTNCFRQIVQIIDRRIENILRPMVYTIVLAIFTVNFYVFVQVCDKLI